MTSLPSDQHIPHAHDPFFKEIGNLTVSTDASFFMNNYQQRYYVKDFRLAFALSKGEQFQSLFEKLMLMRHRGDFMPCRPWGKDGDQKNDGYLKSTRTLFQVYAPNKMNAAKAIKKINEDFEGAKKHWEEYVSEWIFVHNDPDSKLSANIIKALINLQTDNPKIKIGWWGYEEMREKFSQLRLSDVESWFGLPLTMEANINLGYSDLQAVLFHIKTIRTPKTSEVKNVSSGKIEANLLSSDIAEFLKMGMQKSSLVADFFNTFHDPSYGEQIALAFKTEYLALRDMKPRLHPDEIFGRIDAWAGGTTDASLNHKGAVIAIMAYMFDKCEIFEDAKTGGKV